MMIMLAAAIRVLNQAAREVADVYSNGRQPAAKSVDHAAIDARQRELLAQLELDMQMVRLAKQNAVERFLVEADTRMMEIHV